MGLTGYYHMSIQGYERIATPVTGILKNYNFHWSQEAEVAFQLLKEVFAKPLVLALPSFSMTFTIHCDAFANAIGVVLMQKGRSITFYNQNLKGRSLMMSTYEKKLFTLVSVILRWRPYLLGETFVVKTDKQSLKHLLD